MHVLSIGEKNVPLICMMEDNISSKNNGIEDALVCYVLPNYDCTHMSNVDDVIWTTYSMKTQCNLPNILFLLLLSKKTPQPCMLLKKISLYLQIE